MATVVKIGGAGSTTATQSTIVSSITANLAVGDIGVIVASIGSGKLASSVVDSKSNTWTLIKQPANGTSASCNVYYSIITTQLVAGTDTITMTWTGTVARRSWTVLKLTGMTGAPLDLSATGTTTGGTSVALTTSPSSTAQASEVVVVCYGCHQITATTTVFTVDAGYTALDSEVAGSGGTNECSSFVEYKIVAATGIQTGKPTTNINNDIAGVIFTMKIAGLNINAGTAAHASAAYGPTISGTGTATIAPGVAVHANAAYGPTISGSGTATILAGVAAHASAAYGPTLVEALALLPGVAARTATAYGPTVAASSGTTIAAGVAASPPLALGPMSLTNATKHNSLAAIISTMNLFEPHLDERGAWKHPLRADEIDHTANPTQLYSSSVGLERLLGVTAASPVWTANHGRVCIVRCPISGYLRNLSVFVVATDAAASLELSVFDTGETVPGTYTQLYASGAQTIALANHWQPVVDPGAQVPVKQGQHLMVMCGSNSSTLTIAKIGTLPSSAMALPPTGLLVPSGGNLGKICADITAGYTAPVSISEAGMTVSGVIPLIVASILPNPS